MEGQFQLALPAGWDQGRDVVSNFYYNYSRERRFSYDVQLTRGRFTTFRAEDATLKPLDVALNEALYMVTGTTAVHKGAKKGLPRGDREEMFAERDEMRDLTQSSVDPNIAAEEKNCYVRARVALWLTSVGRMLWYCWSTQGQQNALDRFRQAYNDPSCPATARDALDRSIEVLERDNTELELKPWQDDLAEDDHNDSEDTRHNVDDVAKTLYDHMLLGRSFGGPDPADAITARIQRILLARVGWGAKVQILCNAMVVFPQKRYSFPLSPALSGVQNTNEKWLRGTLE